MKKTAVILRERCIRYWSWGKSTASKEWNVYPKKSSTQQCSTVTNNICKQSIASKETTTATLNERHSPWPKNSSLLFHPHSKHDYTLQATGSNLQERCCLSITQISKNTITNTSIQHKHAKQGWLELFITDWLSKHKHVSNREKEIPGLCISVMICVQCLHTGI